MARTSRGCVNCKARRRLCDRAQPRCKQCIKSGLKCAGAVPDHERFFVVSTPMNYQQEAVAITAEAVPITDLEANPTTDAEAALIAAAEAAPAAPRLLLHTSTHPSLCTAAQSAASSRAVVHLKADRKRVKPRQGPAETDHAPLCSSLSSNVELLALGNYMNDNGGYSTIAHVLLRPFDSFFKTDYITQSPNQPAFRYASEALTLLDFSHKVRSKAVKTRAIARYSLALRSVQECIDDASGNVINFLSILQSIWIMVQVEAKLRTPLSTQNCLTHTKGVFDMIQRTAPIAMQAFRQKTEEGLVLDCVRKMGASLDELILLSMETKEAVPPLGSWIVSLLEHAGPPERLSLIASRIPALKARANTISRDLCRGNDLRLHALVQQAEALDQQMLVWRHALPIEWTTIKPSTSTGPCYIYSNLPVAMLVNQWRVWRLHIWLLVLHCVRLGVHYHGHEYLSRAEENLTMLVDGIIDSAEMYLPSITGNLVDDRADPDVPLLSVRLSKLLSLLMFARHVPCLTPSQEQWLQERIYTIQTLCSVHWSSVTPFAVECNLLAHE